MKLHHDDGTLDPELARRELATAAKISNTTDRLGSFEVIKISALIDLAANVKRLVDLSLFYDGQPVDETDDEADDEAPAIAEPLEVGEVVSAEKDDVIVFGTIAAIGETEGEAYAVVDWESGRPQSKAWLANLTRVEAQPEPEGVTADDEAPDDEAPDDEPVEPAEVEPIGPRCGLEFYAEGQPDDLGVCTRRAGHKAGKHSVTRVD